MVMVKLNVSFDLRCLPCLEESTRRLKKRKTTWHQTATKKGNASEAATPFLDQQNTWPGGREEYVKNRLGVQDHNTVVVLFFC